MYTIRESSNACLRDSEPSETPAGGSSSAPSAAADGFTRRLLVTLSWAAAFVLSLVAALLIAGSLFAGAVLSLPQALAVAIPGCLALGAAFRIRATAPRVSPTQIGAWSAAFAVLAAGAFHRLWSPVWGALVSTGGGDAGDHVFYATRLMTGGVELYNRLIVFHVFARSLAELSGLDYASVFAVLFWSALAVFIAAFTWQGATLSQARTVGLHFAHTACFTIALALTGDKVLLPILHVLQGEGFYPQLWGLLPLVGMWLGYSHGRTAPTRVAVLGVGVVVYRFTYALNLTELIVAASLLVAADAFANAPRHLRVAASSAVLLAGGAAAALVLSALVQLLGKGGATIVTDTGAMTLATALLSAALTWDVIRSSADAFRWRSALFVALFGFAASVLQTVAMVRGQSAVYYYVKFQLHPLWLCSAAAAVHLATIDGARVRRSMDSVSTALFVTAVVAGLMCASRGVAPYRPSYRERSHLLASSERLVTMFEPEAYRAITDVLDREHLRFGGYMTRPSWALSGFMNAVLGHAHHFQQPYYKTGAVRAKPGHCVFWDSAPPDRALIDALRSTKGAARIAELEHNGAVGRKTYSTVLNREPREISYVCFPLQQPD